MQLLSEIKIYFLRYVTALFDKLHHHIISVTKQFAY